MTSKLKHTPGPWNEEGIYVILRYADKHDMDIDESDKVMPFSTSDARLIAAAPEMLEALIEQCKNFKQVYPLTWYQFNEIQSTIKAIERATGLSIEEVLAK